jgi:hypothetical protein
MLRRVALLRIEVLEELSASFIRVTRIDELGTTLAVTSNRRTLRRNTKLYGSVWFSSAADLMYICLPLHRTFISVGFDITDRSLITSLAFVRYRRKVAVE